MTTQVRVGAFLTHPTAWQEINWPACYKTVERLQARIVKATQQGRLGKVQSLQWILTHSFSAKAIAVRKVTENRGKRTSGIDGKTWSTPKEKAQAVAKLHRRGYRPLPVKRIYIPKAGGGGKLRPLGIPSMHDRAMQALYLLSLNPVAETLADTNSYGFRPKRSTADAIESCFNKLCRRTSAEWILEGDIRACFDEISHEWLIKNIPIDKQVLGKWLQAGYMEKGQYKPTNRGTPQGGIISPVLANMALDGIEKVLKSCKALKGNLVHLVRYADDFIITGANKEILEQTVRPLIEAFLQERGLSLSENKTKIIRIGKGFNFLGQNIRKYGHKLLIKPSKESCKSLLAQVKAILRAHWSKSSYDLIIKLNSLLRGWGYYHRHIVSKAVFSKMDHMIYYQVWKWCVRKHPNKSKRWVKRKYFSSEGGFGPFSGLGKLSTGEIRRAKLLRLASIKIIRHVIVKGQANPYSSTWKSYFEQRQEIKWKIGPKNKGLLLQIWQKQKGCCPVCQQMIDLDGDRNKHHIQPRKEGGGDNLENLVLLHPTCHRQLHANEKVAHSVKIKTGCKAA